MYIIYIKIIYNIYIIFPLSFKEEINQSQKIRWSLNSPGENRVMLVAMQWKARSINNAGMRLPSSLSTSPLPSSFIEQLLLAKHFMWIKQILMATLEKHAIVISILRSLHNFPKVPEPCKWLSQDLNSSLSTPVAMPLVLGYGHGLWLYISTTLHSPPPNTSAFLFLL